MDGGGEMEVERDGWRWREIEAEREMEVERDQGRERWRWSTLIDGGIRWWHKGRYCGVIHTEKLFLFLLVSLK